MFERTPEERIDVAEATRAKEAGFAETRVMLDRLEESHAMVLAAREAAEPSVYALARVYTSLAVLDGGEIKRFGGLAGEVTHAIEEAMKEAMRAANVRVDQTTIDHLTERAVTIAKSAELAPATRKRQG